MKRMTTITRPSSREDGEFGLARVGGKMGKVVIENECVRQFLTAL